MLIIIIIYLINETTLKNYHAQRAGLWLIIINNNKIIDSPPPYPDQGMPIFTHESYTKEVNFRYNYFVAVH